METTSDTLRQEALAAVRDADAGGPGGIRLQAAALLRARTPDERHRLVDLLAAVDWALAQPVDLSPYLVGYDPATGSARYAFPNGHHASVIPDPRTPLRFETHTSDPADNGRGGVTAALTSAQVEDKLVALAALPAPAAPEPTMAWVTVDAGGRLKPDSVVTVGGETWPIPERTEQAGILAAIRIGVALRERGWRQAPCAKDDTTRPGLIGFPVERIEEV